MVICEVNPEVLTAAGQWAPAVIIGVWLIGQLVELVKTGPERKNQKVIREIARDYMRLTKDIGVLGREIGRLSSALEPLSTDVSWIKGRLDRIWTEISEK